MKKYILPLILLVTIALSACAGGMPAEPTPTPDPFIVLGQQVFTARCAGCHALVPDTIIIGPSLYGIAAKAETRVEGQSAEEYILMSVLRPGDYVVEGFNNIMTTNFAKEVTSEEMNALVAFLLTLK
jgi:cytochrome c551/c552